MEKDEEAKADFSGPQSQYRDYGHGFIRSVMLILISENTYEYSALMPAGGRFDLIRKGSGFLAGLKKGMRYQELEIDLTPGAKIFLYTDGVPEAHNAADEMFGLERMVQALNEGREKSPEELLRHMRKAVDAFLQDAAQFDDLTMLCLEYKGS